MRLWPRTRTWASSINQSPTGRAALKGSHVNKLVPKSKCEKRIIACGVLGRRRMHAMRTWHDRALTVKGFPSGIIAVRRIHHHPFVRGNFSASGSDPTLKCFPRVSTCLPWALNGECVGVCFVFNNSRRILELNLQDSLKSLPCV